MRWAVGVMLLAAVAAGCLQPTSEASPQDRAWEWLLGQRGADGRWSAGLVPYVVEAAVESGKDPETWPTPVPLADQLAWPAEGTGYMASLRPLHAWALLPDHGGRGEAIAQRVLAGHDGRQFGDAALLNDDAFALLALALVDRPEAAARVGALVDGQSDGGGWSWSAGGAPDSDMTGMALAAFSRSGIGGYNATAARDFLDQTHAEGGGHTVRPGGEPNCDSTVWAMRGYLALRAPVPDDDGAFLLSLQRDDGALAYQAGDGNGNALCTVEAVGSLRHG